MSSPTTTTPTTNGTANVTTTNGKAPLIRNGSQVGNATAEQTNGNHAPTKKIKSLVLTSTGSGSDYSNLKLKDEDYPALEGVSGREDMVLVRVKAAGLNFAELMQRQGLYRPSNKCPYTPGFEAAGIVEEVGSNVTDIKVDERYEKNNNNNKKTYFEIII